MDDLIKLLRQKEKELMEMIVYAEEFLRKAPQGTLRINHNKNTDQYYWRTDPKDTEGKYIKKNNEKLIKDLAQKDYAQRLQTLAKRDLEKLQYLLATYKPYEAVNIYEKLSLSRRRLITPYVLSEEEFVKQWEQENQVINKLDCRNEKADSFGIITEKGEIVRSKSEKILADKLYMMQIPYIYELPLYLEGYGYIKPDFTVLNRKNRKMYYWEHFGLMDQADYCEKAILKLELFERNHIFQGKNLIVTYETNKHPLNTRIVGELITEFLL